MMSWLVGDTPRTGDLYVKVDDPDLVWAVERVVEVPRLPPHAELVCASLGYKRILVSQAGLSDRRLYRRYRLPPGGAPAAHTFASPTMQRLSALLRR